MGEPENYFFDFKEVVELLDKKANIHSGIWAISFQFALGGANVSQSPGAAFHPAAIIPILKIGLQKVNEETNLSVDAAKVNPIVPESP